jgi:hypothetical protein
MYVLQITDKKITHSNKISMLCAQMRDGGVKLGVHALARLGAHGRADKKTVSRESGPFVCGGNCY